MPRRIIGPSGVTAITFVYKQEIRIMENGNTVNVGYFYLLNFNYKLDNFF